ncbi:MAG: hypothetical protein JWP45_2472 [Mucilaginibacter sp.]|nr:hypothetical protein [Mucilaginibacter sp.]
MIIRKITLLAMFSLIAFKETNAQALKLQQGLLIKKGTAIRLGSVQAINKRSGIKTATNIYGVFSIPASAGDTLEFSDNNFQSNYFVVTDFTDKIMYLDPAIELNEVVIKENSMQADFKEVQRGYRSKSVFYTGTPHYYYLVLKPMTFIYENFKSEVKNARRFNRYASREMASIKVAERFNNNTIKAVVPIKDSELEDFKTAYEPTVAKINLMSDYDLANYIRKSYTQFKKDDKIKKGMHGKI